MLRPAPLLGNHSSIDQGSPFVAPGPSRESQGDSTRATCEGSALLTLLVVRPHARLVYNRIETQLRHDQHLSVPHSLRFFSAKGVGLDLNTLAQASCYNNSHGESP